MAYRKDTLSRSAPPYVEVKTIKGKQYRYLRWVETNGGKLTRRSKYLGKLTA